MKVNLSILLKNKKALVICGVLLIVLIIPLFLKNKEKELISIDASHFEKVNSNEIEYNLYEMIDSLEGYCDISEIKKMSVTIRSGNYEVLQKDLEISENKWVLDKVSLIPGTNEVIISIETKNGSQLNKSIYINNYEEKNARDIDKKDDDYDNLKNYEEIIMGTDKEKKDTDGDGINDYDEVYITLTSPLKEDSDEDGTTDSEEDFDKDGISNLDEIKKDSNPYEKDSDNDGIVDYEEINTYKTKPHEEDSDGDGLKDYDEIFILEMNPTKYDSYIDIFKETEDKKASIFLENVQASQYNKINIKKSDIVIDKNMKGLITNTYDIDIDSDIRSEVRVNFNIDDIEEDSLPTIYSYNKEHQLFTEQETIIEDKTASMSIKESGTYLLMDKNKYQDETFELDRKTVKENLSNLDVIFVIDISKSMDENDPTDYRKQFMSNFISSMSENDRVAVVLFRNNAFVLNGGFKQDSLGKKMLITDVFNISNDNGTNLNSGTNGSMGLYTGLSLFDSPGEAKRYIIFLTDGEDTDHSYSYEDIYELANERNVTILTIGLGNSVSPDILKNAADNTDGSYFYASDAKSLYNNYEEIKNVTESKLIDSNQDGITDEITQKIVSGEIKTIDGRNPFEKLSYEQIQATSDYDGDGLRNGDEVIVTANGTKVYLKYLSNPLEKDSDGDGISDKEDASPLMKFDQRFSVVSSLSYEPATPAEDGFEKTSHSEYNQEKTCDVKGIVDRATLQANAFGSMPAAKALRHFLSNTGEEYDFGIDWGLVKTYRGSENMSKNTNALMDVIEESVKADSKLVFATNTELTGTNFLTHLEDLADVGWAYAVGHTRATMVAEAQNKGNGKYEMTLYYNIVDYYDWNKDAGLLDGFGGIVNDAEMWKLHSCGVAQQYRITIPYKMKITWNKGDRYYLNKIKLWDTPNSMKVTKMN